MEQNPAANKFAVKKRIFGIALRSEFTIILVLTLALIFREPLVSFLRASLFAPLLLLFNPAVASLFGCVFWFFVQILIGFFSALVVATIARRALLGVSRYCCFGRRETRALLFSVFNRVNAPSDALFRSEQNKNLLNSVLIR